MLYSSGIPILYFVGAVYFFITYWTDKYLIFDLYRKPEFLDHELALRSLDWYKYAIILHFLGGILMFSNQHILPVPLENMKTLFSS
jgi:hypothetical protein